MRYGDRMIVADLSEDFAGTGFNAFRTVLFAGGTIRGFSAPWDGEPSRKDMKDLETYVRGRGAGGLAWFRNVGSGPLEGPITKFLSSEETTAIVKKTNSADGEVVFVVADQPGRVSSALDGLRRLMAQRLGLVIDGEW